MTFKGLHASRFLKLAACAFLVPGLIVALFSIAMPASTTSKVIDNKIDCTTKIRYEALMKRSSLYPSGGVVTPEGDLIAKISSAMIFSVDTTLMSEMPVDVELTGKCLVKITAEGLWERDWDYIYQYTVQKNATDTSLFSKKIIISLSNLDKYIKQIEDETGVLQDRYTISLIQEFNGTIKYQNESYLLEPIPPIKLSYGGGLIQPVAETNSDSQSGTGFPRITSKTFAATHMSTTINALWGSGLPISTARLIFIPLVLLLGCYLGYGPTTRLLASNARMSPAMRINRKYKSRISRVMERPKTTGKVAVEFHTFQELMHMADQKELPILYHEDGDNSIVYFLIDPTAVYSYKTNNTSMDIHQNSILYRLAGKVGSTNVQ